MLLSIRQVIILIKRFTTNQNIPTGSLCVCEKYIEGYFAPHWHEFFEIEFILEGGGNYSIDGNSYAIEENMLFFMSPINFHSVNAQKSKIINIMFSESLCQKPALSALIFARRNNAFRLSRNEAEFLKTVIYELISVSESKNADYQSALLNVILMKLTGKTEESAASELSYGRLAMLYVINNFRRPITLSSAAAYVGLSAAYLSSVFSKEAGITFKEYLNSVRYEHAKNLIVHSNMSVLEVCYESGFGDYANFLRGFKKRYLTSPLKYRFRVSE